MIRVLITGENSYIGENVKKYLMQSSNGIYSVDTKNTIGWEPAAEDFISYDVVFNVAGIAHIKETKDNEHLYYEVNRDLAIKIAKAAKAGGVKQYILLSTMSVYGMTTGYITKDTEPHPITTYGKTKLQADIEINKMRCGTFKFVCLRPPMVYGKGCKGNYQKLRSITLNTPVFPHVNNNRSMVYIGNLCDFIEKCIIEERDGLFFPQNKEYVKTCEMVKQIAKANSKRILFVKLPDNVLKRGPGNLLKKAFGDLVYEKIDVSEKYDFEESITMTEKE